MTIKILVIGGGAIANSLKKEACPNIEIDIDIDIESIGLREFQSRKMADKEILLSQAYDKVIYLGYHKGKLRDNLVAIRQVGKILQKQEFQGELIFTSSHASITAYLSSCASLWERMFSYTRYFYIKRAQEWIVSGLEISTRILYLPIVTGLSDGRGSFFSQLANIDPTELPNGGENRLYLLSAGVLSTYLLQGPHSSKKLSDACPHTFLYSQYCSLNEYLAEKRSSDSDIEIGGFSGPPPSPLMLHRHILRQYFRELILFLLALTLPELLQKEAHKSQEKIGARPGARLKNLPISKYIQLSIDFKAPSDFLNNSKFQVDRL